MEMSSILITQEKGEKQITRISSSKTNIIIMNNFHPNGKEEIGIDSEFHEGS